LGSARLSRLRARLGRIGSALLAALVIGAASGRAAAQPGKPTNAARAAHATDASQRAFERFRAKDYPAARTAFDAAADAAPEADDAATLRFNAAVCAYQLGDYADAEQRFVTLSAKYPELSPLALLHAGLSALGRGDRARARALLEQAPKGDAESDGLRTELERGLQTSAREAQRKAFEQHVQRGLAAFKAERWQDSQTELEAALGVSAGADAKELASIYYLLSNAALERGDTEAARRYADASLEHDASDAALEVQRGDVALEQRDYGVAERSYRRALELGLDARDTPRIQDKLDGLYPVPRAGAYAWALSGGGFDSNAAQSGLAEAIAATETSERTSSAFTSFAVSAGYVWRLSPKLALGPFYAFDWLLLFDPVVRELSLQSHAAGLRLDWAPRPDIDVRLTGSGALSLTGVEQSSAFAFETRLGAELALTHGARLSTLARLDLRGLYGLEGRDYLTGTRIDASVAETWRSERSQVLAGVGFRYNGIGAYEVALRPELLLGCGSRCDGLAYRIPLGYLGPWADLRLSHELTPALRAEANFRFEFRHYTDQSFITPSNAPIAIVINPKTRRDLRYRPGLRMELDLDADKHWLIAADYLVWISRSNVAFAADDPAHALDYDDRNFVQHVIELSLTTQF
jgi:tetratricopeptide (TPR) repeat protein